MKLPFSSWPTAIVAVIGVTIAVGLPVAGYYAYQAYDYVEHDNEFCMSCHLMAAPFEAFARSEHRGLGCKACHQPTLVGRSQMALTQVVDQPEELAAHAVVPDELCTTCHVEGDPEKWRLIAESAGHRVHLESTDPTLDGITCVGCHSSSIHEFSATDQTCAQSECHTDTDISLGRMGDFTIHCVACHAFRAPLAADASAEEVSAALRPESNECLSCHVMRAMVELPPDEPHGGECGSCHNPHVQETASEARQTCVNVGCHEVVEEESDFHIGINAETLQDCVSCHGAHDFEVDGSDCTSCHSDVPGAPTSPVEVAANPAVGSGLLHFAGVGATLAHGTVGLPQAQAADTARPFDHADHSETTCLSCHTTDGSHGRVTVVTADQCQSCHHDAEPARDCVGCHEGPGAIPAGAHPFVQPIRLSVGDNTNRALPFDHATHASEDCASCHTGAQPQLSASGLDCTACHEDHHTDESPCMSCHVAAPATEHPVEQVHVGCSGAGCHEDVPFATAQPAATLPRTRSFCLTCHQDLVDHRVEDTCVACHALPDAGA